MKPIVIFRLRPDHIPTMNDYMPALMPMAVASYGTTMGPLETIVPYSIDISPYINDAPPYDLQAWVEIASKSMDLHARVLCSIRMSQNRIDVGIVLFHPEEVPWAIALRQCLIKRGARLQVGGFVTSLYEKTLRRYMSDFMLDDSARPEVECEPFTKTPLTFLRHDQHCKRPIPAETFPLLLGQFPGEANMEYLKFAFSLLNQQLGEEVDIRLMMGYFHDNAPPEYMHRRWQGESLLATGLFNIMERIARPMWRGRISFQSAKDTALMKKLVNMDCVELTVDTKFITNNDKDDISAVEENLFRFTSRDITVLLECMMDPPGKTLEAIEENAERMFALADTLDAQVLIRAFTPFSTDNVPGVLYLNPESPDLLDRDLNPSGNPVYVPYEREGVSKEEYATAMEKIMTEIGSM